MSITSLRGAASRFFADDSGNALPEYAIVLAVLSIGAAVCFEQVSAAGSARVVSDQNGFANTAETPP